MMGGVVGPPLPGPGPSPARKNHHGPRRHPGRDRGRSELEALHFATSHGYINLYVSNLKELTNILYSSHLAKLKNPGPRGPPGPGPAAQPEAAGAGGFRVSRLPRELEACVTKPVELYGEA